MDDCPELLLKQLCCTCLSQDRKLMQLCRLKEGINNLYFLLSYDSEAYRVSYQSFNRPKISLVVKNCEHAARICFVCSLRDFL